MSKDQISNNDTDVDIVDIINKLKDVILDLLKIIHTLLPEEEDDVSVSHIIDK